MIRRKDEVQPIYYEKCHGGVGTLSCMSMLRRTDSDHGFICFHHDVIPPGTSIGEHVHTHDEEIYYLYEGTCTLLYDGEKIPMHAGDLSIVRSGHSHGLINDGQTDAVLIVVAAE